MKICYIFGAAEGLPNSFVKGEEDIVIAADAGLLHLKRLGIIPDISLGDFDSLGAVPDCGEIIRHPVKKDDTDTLLAIKTGFERGFTHFVLYGCAGKRIDHTLANLQSLNFIAERGGRGFLCGEGFVATALKNGAIHFSENAKGNISVFSAGSNAEGVSIKGLLYELFNTRIDYDFPIGVSNEFIGREAEISVREGTLTLIWSGDMSELKI